MLTDPKLRSKVDALWDKLWTGGLSNPLDAIEQISYLLFLKRLDDAEQSRAASARRRGAFFQTIFVDRSGNADDTLRWSHWTHLPAEEALAHVRERVFPFL